jgi:rRNA maturation endonuclease Nob1
MEPTNDPQLARTTPSGEATATPVMSTNAGSAATDGNQLKYLVIDSGAIIRGEGYSFPRMAEKLVTIQEVISEIRDSKSREKLEAFPYAIDIKVPSDSSMKAVAEFAKKTGDFAALSLTDLKLLALLHTLEVEVNGKKHIRESPKQAPLNRNNQGQTNMQSIKAATSAAAAASRTAANTTTQAQPQSASAATVSQPAAEPAVVTDATENVVDEPQQESVPEDVDEEALHDNEEDAELNAEVDALEVSEQDGDADEDDEADEDQEDDETEGEDEEDDDDEGDGEEENALQEQNFPTLATAKKIFEREAQKSIESHNTNHVSVNDSTTNVDARVLAEAAAAAAAVPAASSDSTAKSNSSSAAVKPAWGQAKSWSTIASAPAATITFTSSAAKKVAESTIVPTASAAQGASFFEGAASKSGSSWTAEDEGDAAVRATSRILSSSGFGGRVTAEKAAEEDDGEGWVTVNNIANVRAHGSGIILSKPRTADISKAPAVKTALITTDFAMQNVTIQMGLHVMSVDGLLIKTVKQFVLMCIGCRTVHYDMDRLFCTKCGGYHLSRIGASVDAKSGNMRLHLKKNYQYDLRGTKFNLPQPGNAGKYDGELLLREDQLHMGVWKQRAVKVRKDVRSAFGEDITSDVGLHINKGGNIVVGYGRKNPNAEKGRERRGKSKR